MKLLSELKAKLGISWDELVIYAVCAHYGLDRAVMALPKQAKPHKPQPKDRRTGKARSKKKGEANGKDKRQLNGQKTEA